MKFIALCLEPFSFGACAQTYFLPHFRSNGTEVMYQAAFGFDEFADEIEWLLARVKEFAAAAKKHTPIFIVDWEQLLDELDHDDAVKT